jgi:hypothetical protein
MYANALTGFCILAVAMAVGYLIVCSVQDPFWNGDDSDDEGKEG